MDKKHLNFKRLRKFWSQYGSQCITIIFLVIAVIAIEVIRHNPEKVFNIFATSELASSSFSQQESHSSRTLSLSEDGFFDGDGHGFKDGYSDGFDSGMADAEQTPSESLDFGDTYDSGYSVGYNRAYARWWLAGYLDAYLSQHPEIDEYDLADDILRCFPDADMADLVDYMRVS